MGAWQQADAAGPVVLQSTQQRRDGTLIPVEVRFVCVRDDAGQLLWRIETVTDLREQLRVDGRSRHREVQAGAALRFRQLAEAAPVGIVLMEPSGACGYANPGWREITGLSLEQAQGEGWRQAIHPDDRERVAEAWERLRHGACVELQFRYRRSSNEARWVQAQGAPVRDDGGAVVGYASVEFDITEQLQQRAAIDGFHSRVRGLAHRLEQLREEERVELARKLHGTVRQELTTLKDNLESLRGRAGAAGEQIGAVATLAERALQSLRHITYALQPPGIGDLGLAETLARCADDCAAESGLRVQMHAEGTLPQLGERQALVLYRVLQEALQNVVRHARATQVEARLWCADGRVHLRVSDDGVGMGDRDRGKPGAFGLLAMSERVAQLGGTLRVFGVTSRGTTLDASLPYETARRQRGALER